MPISIGKYIKKACLSLWTSLIDLFYPQVCEVCEESLVKGEKYICTDCLLDFPHAYESGGERILEQFEEDCRPLKFHALFYYNKESKYKRLIYLIKYHSYRDLAVFMGRMLGHKIAASCEADCIIPIPLHRKREKWRGFNQAREIARGVSEVLHIEIMDNVVYRKHNNTSQTKKNAAERKKNVENIFELRDPERIRGRHVLLIDDVITTGATIGSCLRVLAQAGNVKFSLGCLGQTH